MLGEIFGGIMDVMNYNQSRKQFNYMKQAQQTTWDREDHAVQRHMQDMTAAGLNPILAAGGQAQTSAPVKVDAPQMQMQNILAGSEIRQRLKQTEQEDRRLEQEDKKIDIEALKAGAEVRHMDQSTQNLIEQDRRAEYEFNRAGQRFEWDRESHGIFKDQHDYQKGIALNRDKESTARHNLEMQKIAQDLRHGDQETVLRDMQQRYQQVATSNAQLDNVRKVADNIFAREEYRNRLTKQEQEILALSIANDVAQYDAERFRQMGITSHGNIPTHIVQFLEKQIFERAYNWFIKPFKDIPRTDWSRW